MAPDLLSRTTTYMMLCRPSLGMVVATQAIACIVRLRQCRALTHVGESHSQGILRGPMSESFMAKAVRLPT